MARLLIVDDTARALIAGAITRARSRTIPMAQSMQMALKDHDGPVLRLSDRKPDAPERPRPECLELFDGYQCAFSFEEQPAGIVRHLSIAVNNPGKVPMPAAVDQISKEFGFTDFPPVHGKVWVEEFRPGEFAVNVVELTEPPKKERVAQ
jgi:hypothetical protein